MWKYLELTQTLKALYFTESEIITLLRAAGFDPGNFALGGRGIVVWTGIITRLEQQDRIKQLVGEALKAYPTNPVLLAAMTDVPGKNRGAYSGDVVDWKGGPIAKSTQEKITGGKSTLLPISFLEVGLQRALPVARVVTDVSLGTGFLISSENLFITNNHVLDSQSRASVSKVQFNYQKTAKGGIAKYEEFDIDKSIYETSVEDDWTVVKVKGDPAAKYGFLKLLPASVKKDDYVNIIQHPGGEDKQIGLYHNVVTYAGDDRVQYLTDTLPGSSGAAVFNSFWDVVALHHSGGWLLEPGAAAGTEVLRNEGININKIIFELQKRGFNI